MDLLWNTVLKKADFFSEADFPNAEGANETQRWTVLGTVKTGSCRAPCVSVPNLRTPGLGMVFRTSWAYVWDLLPEFYKEFPVRNNFWLKKNKL